MHRTLAPFLLALLLAGGIAAFHAVIQPVWLGWDPDAALYLMHARNIAESLPYATTAYLHNPAYAIHPAAYPPGLPLLLAPIVDAVGLDLASSKLLIAFCFSALLIALFLVARRLLAPWSALLIVALVGLNPQFQMQATMLYSEYPFMLAAYSGLLLLGLRDGSPDGSGSTKMLLAVLAGLLIGFAVLIRSVGFLLLLSVALAAAVRWYTTGFAAIRPSGIALASALLLIVIAGMMLPNDGGTYVGYVSALSPVELVAGIRQGIRVYVNSISNEFFGLARLDATAWYADIASAILLMVSFAVMGFAVGGLLLATRERCSPFEIFTLLYGAFIAVYPIRYEPARYALPIVPLLAVYAAFGLSRLLAAAPHALRRSVAGVITGVTVFGFAVSSPVSLASVGEPWPLSESARQMFNALSELTEPEDVVLAFEPTTVALFTGRQSSIWPHLASVEEFEAYADEIGASFVIPRPPGATFRVIDFDAMVATRPEKFILVFENERYRIFEIRR